MVFLKNKKFFLLLLFILIIAIVALGCAQEPTEDENNETDVEDNMDDQNEPMETDVEETIEGEFVGWVDSNSFEVMKDDTPYVIRTSEAVMMPDDALDGRTVRVTYVRNDQGQNIIKTIEVLE